jgi:hypothetical protein
MADNSTSAKRPLEDDHNAERCPVKRPTSVTIFPEPKPSHANACLHSYNYDDITLVVVGSKKTTFIVRHDAICANSKFFQTNRDTVKASHDKTVHL